MDKEERQRRQREFTIYLVLFILLVIVGAITTNGQQIDGRRYESPYGNPYYGGYSSSPYGNNIFGYAEYRTPYYAREYGMTPSYVWNPLHGYGNGPPFHPNAHPNYGPQGYGQMNPGFGPQGYHPGWGYNGGAQIRPGYGYPPLYNNGFYRSPALPMVPHMASPPPPSYPFWGNEARMMGHPTFMGSYYRPNVEGYGQPFYPPMQQPYNQAWW
jgi:hypothetical protein